MKKLMFAAALAAAFASQSQAIESGVVGYTQQALVNGRYNFVAISLGSVGKDGMWNLNDNVQGKNLSSTDDDSDETGLAKSDAIQIWDPLQGTEGGYDDLYLYDCGDPTDPINGWWSSISFEKVGEGIYQNGFPTGAGMWYLKRDNGQEAALIPSGEVVTDKTIVKRLYKGRYNQLGDPFPVRLNMNDPSMVEWTDSSSTDDDSDETGLAKSDAVQIWDPLQGSEGGYDDLYLYDSGDPTDDLNGWWSSISFEKVGEGVYPNGFDIGQQMWYLPRGEFSTDEDKMCKITFFNPIK